MNETHTISSLCERSALIAREKGWVNDTDPRPYHTAVILFHSEISEALEEYRKHKELGEVYAGVGGKPEGIPVEIADLVIRICQRTGTDGHVAQLEAGMADHYKTPDGKRDFSKIDFELFLADLHRAVSLSEQCYDFRDPKRPHLAYLGRALVESFLFFEDRGIDLWAAIDTKEAYNRTREFRHGGKKI
jgi:hypothetical protein